MDVQLYTPYSKQLQVHNSCDNLSYLFTTVNASRQTGKTTLAMQQVIKWGLEHSDAVIMWVSPTYAQTIKVYKNLIKAVGEAPFVASYRQTSGDTEIIFTNGSVIKFKSAHSEDNLRGETVNFMIIDEAAFVKESTFLEILLPMLNVAGKKCLVISTPKGKNNWFFHHFQRGKKGEKGYKSFSFNCHDNPYANKAIIAIAKKNMPKAMFDQEYLAMFVDASSVIENIEDCCNGQMQWLPTEGKTYFAGIDLALKDDYTVFSVVDADGNLVYFDRFNQVTAPQLKERLITNLNAWKPANTLFEVNNMGQVIFDDLKNIYKIRNIQPWNTSYTSKNDIITKLINAFSSKEITCPNDENLKGELETFEMVVTPSGKVTYRATSGYHDDIVMSLAIARQAQLYAGNNQFNLKFVNY